MFFNSVFCFFGFIPGSGGGTCNSRQRRPLCSSCKKEDGIGPTRWHGVQPMLYSQITEGPPSTRGQPSPTARSRKGAATWEPLWPTYHQSRVQQDQKRRRRRRDSRENCHRSTRGLFLSLNTSRCPPSNKGIQNNSGSNARRRERGPNDPSTRPLNSPFPTLLQCKYQQCGMQRRRHLGPPKRLRRTTLRSRLRPAKRAKMLLLSQPVLREPKSPNLLLRYASQPGNFGTYASAGRKGQNQYVIQLRVRLRGTWGKTGTRDQRSCPIRPYRGSPEATEQPTAAVLIHLPLNLQYFGLSRQRRPNGNAQRSPKGQATREHMQPLYVLQQWNLRQ